MLFAFALFALFLFCLYFVNCIVFMLEDIVSGLQTCPFVKTISAVKQEYLFTSVEQNN